MSKPLKIYACTGIKKTIGSLADWTTNEVLRKYIPDASEYFLYTYIPENEASYYSPKIQRKRRQQLETKKWIKDIAVPVYFTEEEFESTIRDNIVNTFNKESKKQSGKAKEFYYDSPEQVIAILRDPKDSTGAITMTAAALASIIGAVLSFVLGLITLLLKYFQQKNLQEAQAKYVVPDENVINDSIAEAEDWGIATSTKKTTTSGSSWLMLALIPTALFMFGNKKSN